MRNQLLTLFTVLLTAAFTPVPAQSLTFCEKLDAAGNPVNSSTTFTVGKNGGPVIFYFVPAQGISSPTINFDIYFIERGKEVFHSTLKQATSSNKPISKQMTFYEAGYYRIYVYDEKDKMLAKGELSVKRSQ
jgi:hypothetical protein